MAAMTLEVTETQAYTAWRLLEALGRGRSNSSSETAEATAPAMSILESVLTELGFTIVDRQLTPIEVGEEEQMARGGRIGTLPAKPGIDNELPPEGEAQSAKKSPPSHKPEERKHDERKHEEEHPKRR